MYSIILAGGSGTRLWPLSRKSYPKQFLSLGNEKTLLQQTVQRIMRGLPDKNILVITNKEYHFHVLDQIIEESKNVKDNIILEPVGRNTAPAIALAIKYALETRGCSTEDVLFVSPADHIINDVERFTEYMLEAGNIAREGWIVTFGIKPHKPETGYGYIKKGQRIDKMDAFRVDQFAEKPDLDTAEMYLKEGNYYWNSGMFAFTIDSMLDELSKYAPEIYKGMNASYEEVVRSFGDMPNVSIDYAIMEKSDRVAVMPMDISWSDIGSWDSVYEMLDKNGNGNVKLGEVVSIDTQNSLIIGNKRLLATIGLEDMLIVETDDAILISKKGEAQKVKGVVGYLKENGRKETDEHVTTYRPWGSYTILEEGDRYKIKRIVVNPGERLSLQLHHHRSEHWVVIKGTAKVTIGEDVKHVHENESIYVPKTTMHRLENPGIVALEIIEVQNGEYVGEDDIVRLDDQYGRIKK